MEEKMILIKRLRCGKDTLELIIQTEEEGRMLKEFARPGERLIAETITCPERSLPDLVIRKEIDQ